MIRALWLCLWIGLVACGQPTTSASLLADLDDPLWQVRASSAEALGQHDTPEVVGALIESLDDDSSEVRAAAAMSLGRLDAKSARLAVVRRVRKERSTIAKVHALYALGEVGNPSDADLVIDQLDADARRVNRAAARVLWRLLDRSETVASLRKDLQSNDVKVRRKAADWAVELELRELHGWEDALLADPDPAVRASAWREFTRDIDHGDIPALRGALEDSATEVRREALIGIQDLEASEARADVLEVLGSDRVLKVRKQAARTLATLDGTKGSAQPFLWHLVRVDDRVQRFADGGAQLNRDLTLKIDRSATRFTSISLLLPHGFSEVESVTSPDGEVRFAVDAHRGEHQLGLKIPPLRSGDSLSLQIVARTEHMVDYHPGPFQVRVDASEVVVLPATDSDPPRGYSRTGDLAWIGGLAMVASSALWVGCIGLRRRWGHDADPVILAAILTTGLFFVGTPQLLEDNLSYYAMARSAVFDGDLDRLEEVTLYNPGLAFAPDSRGPQDPVIGAVVRIPAVAIAHLVNRGLGTPWAPTGFSFPYLYGTAILDFALMLGGCLATLALVRRRVGVEVALPAVLCVALGTNLLLFLYGWTASSFQPSFFGLAVFLWLWDRTDGDRPLWIWLLGGVGMGLLGITRTMNLAFVGIPILLWAWEAYRDRGLQLDRALPIAVFGGGLALGIGPQLWVQYQLDHVFFVDSYGVGSGRFTGFLDNWYSLLIDRGEDNYWGTGLFLAMPIGFPICAGAALWLRRVPHYAGPLLAVVAVQFAAICAYEVYWGYHTFASPYLAPASPIAALALAHLLEELRGRSRAGLWGMGALLFAFILRNTYCMIHHMADEMIGDWAPELGTVEILHRMWMLETKWHDGVLGYSSNFGFLVRELVGGLRAFDPLTILGAMVAFAVIAGPVGTGCWAWLHREQIQVPWRAVAGGLAAFGLIAVPLLAVTSARTELDRDYILRKWTERKRELRPVRLEDGENYTWKFSTDSPLASLHVVTFLSGAEAVETGTKVGELVVKVGGETQRIPLIAGENTADFAIDRPEGLAGRGHGSPVEEAAWSFRVRDGSSHFYSARAYLAEIALPAGVLEGRLQVSSFVGEGELVIPMMMVIEEAVPAESRRRWIADRW